MATLRTTEIPVGSSITLIAVEAIDSGRCKTDTGCQLFGNIKPTALVVCGPDKSYAVDMAAKPINIDQLRQNIPELDARIVSLDKAPD